MMVVSFNFAFLEVHNPQLERLGAQAEQYFISDPNTCLIKLRQFGELLARLVAAKMSLYVSEDEQQIDLLRRLKDRGLLKGEVDRRFHELRHFGNKATHKDFKDSTTALNNLKYAQLLGIWFHQVVTKNPRFNPGSFIPPSASKEELAKELARKTEVERFTTYRKAEETLKQQQNCINNLESVSFIQATAHAEAEVMLCSTLTLYSEWNALLASKLPINWHDPTVVDLFARLQPYIARDKSMQSFTVNVESAINLSTELGFSRPAYETFGLAAWLQDTVAAWISETQTSIAYANDVVTAMTEAESAAKTYTHNSNFLAQLRRKNQQNLEHQPNLRQEIENLRKHQLHLNLATSEIDEWFSIAYGKTYAMLNQCFQNGQCFTEELILLPKQLNVIAQKVEASDLPWEFYHKRGLVEVSKLLIKYRQWDKVSRIAKRIYSLIVETPNEISQQSPSENAIAMVMRTLTIHNLAPVLALEKLLQLAQSTIDEINRPPEFWSWTTTTLPGHSHFYCAATKIKVIQRQTLLIVQSARPSTIEPTLKRITDETVSSIAASARAWLNQLQTSAEQKLCDLEEQLNELQRLSAKQQLQIPTTQKQVETACSEASIKFRRVIALLRKLVPLPQLPNELQVLVKQYLHTPANILSQKSELLLSVHSWASRTEKLKILISSLDTFAVLSTIKNAIEIEVSVCQNTTDKAFKQLTDSQIQLRERKTQLQQQLDNITIERNYWQSSPLVISDYLKATVPVNSLFSLESLRQVEL